MSGPSFSEFVRMMAPHPRDAFSLLKSPDGWRLLVCFHDGNIRQWKAPGLLELIQAACAGDSTAINLNPRRMAGGDPAAPRGAPRDPIPTEHHLRTPADKDARRGPQGIG